MTLKNSEYHRWKEWKRQMKVKPEEKEKQRMHYEWTKYVEESLKHKNYFSTINIFNFILLTIIITSLFIQSIRVNKLSQELYAAKRYIYYIEKGE